MPAADTADCDVCNGWDLAQLVQRSRTPGQNFLKRGRQSICVGSTEVSCHQCNRLVRLARTLFNGHNIHHLAAYSVSHPTLSDYNATYFSISGEYLSSNQIHLLPKQARFVDAHTGKETYLPCTRAVDLTHVDWKVFNNSVRACRSEHPDCEMKLQHRSKPKRIIDCKSRTFCAASDSQYICLSYVWGGSPTGQATSGDLALLEAPQTVIDAMSVTVQLGMRYLWVDRYCIDQNNTVEKHEAIRNMDSIYRNAYVTIIAAAGSDANDGLPGVSRPRKPLESIDIGGHDFMVARDPKDIVEASIWNSRGWTYQEMLLSRRRLIFTDYQIYFQCQISQTLEQLDKDFPPTFFTTENKISKRLLPIQDTHSTVDDLYARLREFYHRTLRYDTDNINAFAGIFRALSGKFHEDAYCGLAYQSGVYMPRQNPHFYGIPVLIQDIDLVGFDRTSSLFGLSLGWKLEVIKKEDFSSKCNFTKKSIFPSWSWAFAKAQFPQHVLQLMAFWGRPHGYIDIGGADFSASVEHRSGERMSMSAFAAQEDDYTLFHPW